MAYPVTGIKPDSISWLFKQYLVTIYCCSSIWDVLCRKTCSGNMFLCHLSLNLGGPINISGGKMAGQRISKGR